MSIKFALILSVLLQFATAIIALTLIKRTKTNIAWWLISLGFVLMAFRRLFEFFQAFSPENNIINGLQNSWIGVLISVLLLVSLLFIRRIFNIQQRFDELKKKNEARVFSAIIRTEEDQKNKFSKELHDGLGPLLSSVKMTISGITSNPKQELNKKLLDNAEHLIDESITTVKEISNNLSPRILNNFGLHKAIKSFINKLPQIDSPKITYSGNLNETRFSYNIETIIYRIICELLTNSLKHAEAQYIYIDLNLNENKIHIKYMDDGKGCDIENDSVLEQGLGLTNIQSRIKSVQGSCEINTMPDEGFNINIEINPE